MTLLIGYGNPGRCDDGLGPALAERIAARALPGVEVAVDYQLTVEHALLVAGAARVVFADAEIGGPAPFRFARVAAAGGDISSHSIAPGTVLALAGTLYGAAPEAYLLGIAGAEFGRVAEGLSPTAERNLAEAEAHIVAWLTASIVRDAAAASVATA